MKNTPTNGAEYRRLNSVAKWEVKSLMERREKQYVSHFQREQHEEQEEAFKMLKGQNNRRNTDRLQNKHGYNTASNYGQVHKEVK
jgi:hypothetical protein